MLARTQGGMEGIRRVESTEMTENQNAIRTNVANDENTCQCVAAGGSAAFSSAVPLFVSTSASKNRW